jgi:hypothetical protein
VSVMGLPEPLAFVSEVRRLLIQRAKWRHASRGDGSLARTVDSSGSRSKAAGAIRMERQQICFGSRRRNVDVQGLAESSVTSLY